MSEALTPLVYLAKEVDSLIDKSGHRIPKTLYDSDMGAHVLHKLDLMKQDHGYFLGLLATGGSTAIRHVISCNARKGNRTPQEARMTLRRVPREPRFIPWVVVRRNTAPDEWRAYLALYSVGIEERVGR